MTKDLGFVTDPGDIFRTFATHSGKLKPRVTISAHAARLIPGIIDRIAQGRPVRGTLKKYRRALEAGDAKNPATDTISEVLSEFLLMMLDCMIDQDVRAVSPTRASELLYNLPACFDLDVDYLMQVRSEVPLLPAEGLEDFEIVPGGLMLISRLALRKAAGATLWLSIPEPQEYYDWTLKPRRLGAPSKPRAASRSRKKA